MAQAQFSGTFRGGSTVGPGASASGIASNADIGTQGGLDTDVFKWSGATATHRGGAAHEALKELSLIEVSDARVIRAKKLAEKADVQTKILQKKFHNELGKTVSTNWKETINLVDKKVIEFQSWLSGLGKEAEEDEEEEDHHKIVGKITKEAAVCHLIANNAKEAAYRAEQEIENARIQRRGAIEAARTARTLKHQEMAFIVDDSDQERQQKPPSVLKVTISEGKNFPTRTGAKHVNPYAVVSFWNPDKPDDETQVSVTPIKWKSRDPDFLFTSDFFVVDDWDDETRPEVVEIAFYDCLSTIPIKQPVVGDDPLIGAAKFVLHDICKKKRHRTYPDGRVELGHFRCEYSKWHDLHDEEEQLVETVFVDKEGVEERTACEILVGIQYLDSANKPKTTNGIQAVQMPKRRPYPDPAPNPPPSW
eukprot:CAMPEP_0181300776 /NCGR_PEP_ID=MMETSP1101-20121128/7069_1 /TAXON_ID=46948 /ORGANISM="Rhodomonas abbreviata, Strain Caron Lab Isolate" /LENGTH=420 /DNA_ID=CAMNT_0023406033 /DNA_START=53 /DNA_END=1312 /DNA_ORIENTATION=-